MNGRNITGLALLAAVVLSIAYIWQPWNPGEPSLRLGLDLQGGLRVVLEADQANPSEEDIQTARNVIENRINEFGVAEPVIQTSGRNRVIVELPGLGADQQDRALDLIGQQAVLEFRLVRFQSNGVPDEMLTLNDLEDVAFTGEIIRSARAEFGQPGSGVMGPMVTFEIAGQYQQAFGQFTANNLGRRMAIVLDDQVITAPTLQGRIANEGQITGIGSLEEATDVALVLRSGSLPISLHVEEIRQIGPTLGADSIEAGMVAGTVGAIAVIIAVLVMYGPLFGGVLALGVLLVMLFVFGILAGLGAALTLPGLAGLILTIGAAVDGNVISFERIKEELAEGKSLRVAMKAGFGHSLSAIIDANVTSLLVAAALYQYTTGPVRGFATILAIGIIASVFVNTVVVPFILESLTRRGIKNPRMPKGFYAQGIPFIRNAPIAMVVAGVLLVASLGGLGIKGLNFSTDFTGGLNVLYEVPEGTTVSDVRETLANLNFEGVNASDATIVEVEDNAGEASLISVRVGAQGNVETGEVFATTLASALGAQQLSAEFVGPSVGADLRTAALVAILVSIGLILVYVGLRFWPNWPVALSTVIGAVFDVLIVLGFLILIGAQFSIPVLAAVLFVVGYSLNDSIVIADRLRENLRKIRGRSYRDIFNLTINQTLSRTVITSATTLLAVVALLIFGGAVLRDFAWVLVVGIISGSLSSIFIMAPIVIFFKERGGKRRKKRVSQQSTAA